MRRLYLLSEYPTYILDRHTGLHVELTSQIGSNTLLSRCFLCCKTEQLPVSQRKPVSEFCHETLVNLIHTFPTSLPNLCMHFFVPYSRQIKSNGEYYSNSRILCLCQLTTHIYINSYLLSHSNLSSPTCFGLLRPSSGRG